MDALEVTNSDPGQYSYETGLLVSVLLRYPEVGIIKCSQEQQTLVLKFIVSRDFDFDTLQRKINQALEVFHKIERSKMLLCTIEKLEQELDLVVITRDLQTITQREMNLIIEIMRSELGGQLLTDESELPEDEILLQEEVISHMLLAIRTGGQGKSITGLREDGRVLIFNG